MTLERLGDRPRRVLAGRSGSLAPQARRRLFRPCLHTAGATGSIPVPPTIQKCRRNKDLGSLLDRCCFLNGCFSGLLGQFWDSAGGAAEVKRHLNDRRSQAILQAVPCGAQASRVCASSSAADCRAAVAHCGPVAAACRARTFICAIPATGGETLSLRIEPITPSAIQRPSRL